MDFPSLDAAEVHLRSSDRARTLSQESARNYRARLRSQNSSASLRSNMSDASEIIAPTPRRHALMQTDSLDWLRTPIESPRPISPLNPSFRKVSRPNMSFSALHEDDKKQKTALEVLKQRQNNTMGASRRWIRHMSKNGMKDLILPCMLLANACVKIAIGLGPYSGYEKPPMYGDYEAQRHWMEITQHLPTSQWYTYDLQYWGLDYPPLTAYHSWLCGKIGSIFNPNWFALDSSRGYESNESKSFMRTSVLVSDFLIFIPAVVMMVKVWNSGRGSRMQNNAILSAIFHPSLLLIDYGHFQYNSVMLGFTMLSLNAFATGHDLVGAALFVLSLGFKQMALYYAPAIGAYLLGKCLWLGPSNGSRLFLRLAVVTLSTFIILFIPFLNPSSFLQVVGRIFPFDRGLFEDKVANFWCATNVLIKWRNISSLTRTHLLRMSTVLTCLAFSPSVYGLIMGAYTRRLQAKDSQTTPTPCPTVLLLPYALFTTSMSFFLFSFQVHEKSILLPLLPITMLMVSASPDSQVWEWGTLVNNVALFSLYPLLKKDGLGLQYGVMVIMWNWLVGFKSPKLWPTTLVEALTMAAYFAMAAVHTAQLFVPPPARLPDIYPVLNVLISSVVFGMSWLWSIKRGVEVGWAMGGLNLGKPPPVVSKRKSKNNKSTVHNGHLKSE